jgi:hypothetical protein
MSASARFDRARRARAASRALSPFESKKLQRVRSTMTSRVSCRAASSSVRSSAAAVARSTSPVTDTTGVPLSSCSVVTANLWVAVMADLHASRETAFDRAPRSRPPGSCAGTRADFTVAASGPRKSTQSAGVPPAHVHGLVDDSIKRSREGLRAVSLALLVLVLAAGAQVVVFVASGSIALLADVIHNVGDASTAIPLGVAFALRSARAERWAGLAVVLAIFVSACLAGYEAIVRLIDPREVDALGALAAAGAIGFGGNWVAAGIRTRAGHRLDSPALIADGAHARADAYVSLAVVASAGALAAGLEVVDPLIGLGITVVILRIAWQSWQTVRGGHSH